MSTNISIHHAEMISASTVQGEDGCSPHLTINWQGGNSYEASGSITFYLKDAVLNNRLIEVINQVVAEAAR